MVTKFSSEKAGYTSYYSQALLNMEEKKLPYFWKALYSITSNSSLLIHFHFDLVEVELKYYVSA